MSASTVAKSRIPRFRFKIGGLEEIFYSNDSTKSKTTHEYDANTLFSNIDSRFPGNVDYCKEVGVLTIKPHAIAENTRLVGALVENTKESTSFANDVGTNLFNQQISYASDLLTNYSTEYFTTNWTVSKTLRSFYITKEGLSVYQKDNTLDDISNYKENNTDGACRIKNIKVNTPGTNKYCCLEFKEGVNSNLKYTPNKGVYFEFNIGNSFFNSENLPCSKITKAENQSNVLTGQYVSVNDKHICIQIGATSDYRKYLLLQENERPVLVTEYIKTKVFNAFFGEGIIKFPIADKFYVSVVPYINSILISSNLFSTFNVNIDFNPNSTEIYDCMGSGIKVNFIGFGEFSLAFGQIKYKTSNMLNPTNYVYCTRAISVQEWDTNKPFTAEASVMTKSSECNYWMEVQDATTNNDGSPINSNSTPKKTWALFLFTDNPFLTPYVYKVRVGQDITQVAPAAIQDMATTWQNLLVTNINLSTSAEGLNKLKKSGSITFSNKKTYIDGVALNPLALDWTIINQRAIKIEFAYSYVGNDSKFIDITEDKWQPLFAGFITDPDIKKSNYGDSTVTFKLEDRWMQIEQCKVSWSKIYDGVKQIDTILDCLRESGIYAPKKYTDGVTASHDVIISSDPMVTSFVLPLNPNALVNPAYKPKIKSGVEAFLDTVCEISNLVVYFDNSGKFNIKHLREITGSFSASNYTVFADYVMDPAAVPATQITNYPDLTPPWNNIQSPQFTRDVKTGLFNTVFVFGPNEVPNTIAVDWEIANDLRSIHDTSASNYIGYKKILFKALLAYGSKQLRQLMARLYLAEASYPQEVYQWTSFGNTLPMFSYVNFRENYIKTGVSENTVYFLIKNDFSFNSAKLECTSSMQAKRLKGLFQLYGIIE